MVLQHVAALAKIARTRDRPGKVPRSEALSGDLGSRSRVLNRRISADDEKGEPMIRIYIVWKTDARDDNHVDERA